MGGVLGEHRDASPPLPVRQQSAEAEAEVALSAAEYSVLSNFCHDRPKHPALNAKTASLL
ncbi:hypothetical protein J6590_082649 [Homalodisca vitripennis]|nr:hypothetical protein J6590_082649 [Homalodisca vitripennis]